MPPALAPYLNLHGAAVPQQALEVRVWLAPVQVLFCATPSRSGRADGRETIKRGTAAARPRICHPSWESRRAAVACRNGMNPTDSPTGGHSRWGTRLPQGGFGGFPLCRRPEPRTGVVFYTDQALDDLPMSGRPDPVRLPCRPARDARRARSCPSHELWSSARVWSLPFPEHRRQHRRPELRIVAGWRIRVRRLSACGARTRPPT